MHQDDKLNLCCVINSGLVSIRQELMLMGFTNWLVTGHGGDLALGKDYAKFLDLPDPLPDFCQQILHVVVYGSQVGGKACFVAAAHLEPSMAGDTLGHAQMVLGSAVIHRVQRRVLWDCWRSNEAAMLTKAAHLSGNRKLADYDAGSALLRRSVMTFSGKLACQTNWLEPGESVL